jgi:hypothetical protein
MNIKSQIQNKKYEEFKLYLYIKILILNSLL